MRRRTAKLNRTLSLKKKQLSAIHRSFMHLVWLIYRRFCKKAALDQNQVHLLGWCSNQYLCLQM